MKSAKREKKFWLKLALSHFLFTFGSLFLVGIYLAVSLTPQVNMLREEVIRMKTEQLTRLMSEEMVRGDGKIEIRKALDLFSGPWDPEVWILDMNGKVTMMSPKARTSFTGVRQEIVDKTFQGKPMSGYIHGKKVFYYTAPIIREGKTSGIIYVNMPQTLPLQNRMRALVPLVKAFTLIAFLALIVSLYMSRKIVRPMEEMIETARRIGEGELSARVSQPYFSEEMAILGRTLNSMAGKLERSLEELESEKKQLEYMEKMRRDLITSISHEIRTPLSTLMGCSEALQDGVVTGEDASRYVDVLHSEVSHLSHLINDLLELAKLEAKAITLSKESFSLRELVGDILRAKEFELSKAEIAPLFSGEDIPVLADRERIRQVISNLLENTMRYCPPKTVVTIRLENRDGGIYLVYEDRGPGVPEEDLPRLFEHFYRVEKSRSKSRGGYGLGLAIVKNIVDVHEGTIRAENVEEGGLRFLITLPPGGKEKDDVGCRI